jgi:hypothetical protein
MEAKLTKSARTRVCAVCWSCHHTTTKWLKHQEFTVSQV